MALAGMRARNERVEPLDLVNKAMLGEKIKRAVGHRRLRTETFGPQDIENFVSAARAMRLQQDLQNPAAHRCQLHAQTGAIIIRCRHTIRDTGGVIMRVESKGLFGAHDGVDML